MAIDIRHGFTSPQSDGSDATQVQPSHWNAGHTITMGTGYVLGRTTAGTGAVEEVSFANLKIAMSFTKSDVGLSNVENTALSTWGGSANIVTVGTIATGTWGGTAIALNKGGTGSTTQAGAANAILPSQATHSGKFLTTNGTDVSWAAGGGGAAWGGITGTLSAQTDLQSALDAKAPLASPAFTTTISIDSDAKAVRDAANVWAFRNGTSAQGFRIYKTYTDASNYERLVFSWAGTDFKLGCENAGTGSATNQLHIHAGGQMRFYLAGTQYWQIASSGFFLPATNNVSDLGSTGQKVRTGYFGTSVVTAGLTVGFAAKTANYTLVEADNVVTGDATTATFSLTLPTAVGCAGRRYTIKKITAANTLNIATTSSQTIDGAAAPLALTTQWSGVVLISDGANWLKIGSF